MRAAGRTFRIVLLLAVVAAGALAVLKRQALYDWLRLYRYQPPLAIAQLAAADTMTPYAQHVFYVNHPDLTADKTYFNQQCAGKEQTIVLGCYHSDQLGIYVYLVNQPDLNGVEQVTAAHEMLHAAYDRLSAKDRASIDAMLQDYYANDLHDQRIISEIDLYKKTEPHDVVNEMHSVFGTEIAQLPPALETYYKRYFTDRQKIAEYSASYEAAFTTRQQQVVADDAQLAAMNTQIDDLQSAAQQKSKALASQLAELNAERSQGNIEAYNAGVAPYNAAVDAYNALVAELKTLIAQYNTLVGERNAIAIQENELSQAINSQSQAAPAAAE